MDKNQKLIELVAATGKNVDVVAKDCGIGLATLRKAMNGKRILMKSEFKIAKGLKTTRPKAGFC